MKPKFEVSETPSHFTIAGYIPGMDQKDINISLGNNQQTITIEGVREPSDHEDSVLRNQLRRKYGGEKVDEISAEFVQDIDATTENQFLLKAGAGRFGKFSETYQLPDYVDTDRIGANYEGGVLNVTIPKLRRYPQRSPFGFPASFANDQDFWW